MPKPRGRKIADTLDRRIDQLERSFVARSVEHIVRVGRCHFSPQHEVDELVRVVGVRRVGRNGEEVEPLECALLGDDVGDLDAGIGLGGRGLGDEHVARIADR